MVKQLLIFFSVLFFSNSLVCMDLAVEDTSELFAKIPNKVRRKCIFPLLKQCTTIKEARNLLCSVALISKQSYAQMNCQFFVRDAVKILATHHNLPDGTIAVLLNTYGSRKYNDMGNEIFVLTISSNFDENNFDKIRALIDQAGDFNFRTAKYGTTPLMRAVYINSPHFVGFLLARGAQVNECDMQRNYVRNFNLIYDYQRLSEIIKPLTQYMLKIETHNSIDPDTIDCRGKIYRSRESIVLRNALLIDRMLEQNKAFSTIRDTNHPFIRMLSGNSKIRRAFRYAVENNKQVVDRHIPTNIQPYLVVSPRPT